MWKLIALTALVAGGLRAADLAACPAKIERPLGPSQFPHFHGAFAEYYYLRPGGAIFKVPDELPDSMVASVNCALSQVIFGLDRVGLSFGGSVVIQGAGGLGLQAAAVAKDRGAATVIVVLFLAFGLVAGSGR